jgi:hypothetical protein
MRRRTALAGPYVLPGERELLIPARLIHGLAVIVATSGEPLDRLLDAAHVERNTELMTEPDDQTGTDPAGPPGIAHTLRRVWIDTPTPAPRALVSDELHLASLT